MIDYYSLELPDIKEALHYIDDFMNHQIIRKLSNSSIDAYSSESLLFFSIFRPVDINRLYIESYIKDYGDISISSKNKRNSALRTILKYLVNCGFDNCNIKISYIKNIEKLPTFISEEKMQSLINTYRRKRLKHKSIWRGRRDYAILLFIYATGMRVSEIVNFNILDLEENWVRVNNGKGDKDRYIPIAKIAVKALNDYLAYVPQHIKSKYPNAFLSDLLVPYTNATFYHYCKNHYGYNPHIFRHTFATHLIINGCDEYVLMDFLGHSSLSTTQIYTHIQNNQLKETVHNHFPIMSV